MGHAPLLLGRGSPAGVGAAALRLRRSLPGGKAAGRVGVRPPAAAPQGRRILPATARRSPGLARHPHGEREGAGRTR